MSSSNTYIVNAIQFNQTSTFLNPNICLAFCLEMTRQSYLNRHSACLTDWSNNPLVCIGIFLSLCLKWKEKSFLQKYCPKNVFARWIKQAYRIGKDVKIRNILEIMIIKTVIVNNSFCKFASGKKKENWVNARAKLGEKLEQ